MSITRRNLLKAASALPLAGIFRPGYAADYPSRPVRIIVPASPATSIDVTARFFSEPLAQRLGVPVVVENRPGTGGLLAYTAAAKAPNDGYSLIIAGIPMYLLPLLSQGTVSFDPQRDFSPVTRVARVSNGLVVSSESPYQTLPDLLAAMKARPGQITYSSQGIGSTAHLCGVLLTHMSQNDAQHIPYTATTAATLDVAANRIDFTCQSAPSVMNLMEAGKLRLLAVTGEHRWPAFPDIPTIAEAGVPGFEISSWLDFVAPKGTPEPVVQRLTQELQAVANTPEYEDFCTKQLIFRESTGNAQLVQEMGSESAKWKKIVEIARLA